LFVRDSCCTSPPRARQALANTAARC
jgi:hypothetical protein